MKKFIKKEWFKIIIIILLTIGVLFYCWGIYKEQKYYSDKQKCIEVCFYENTGKSSEKIEVCEKICSYKFSRTKVLEEK